MNLLVLAFDYYPDKGPGADRISAFVEGLRSRGNLVEVIRAEKIDNRYRWRADMDGENCLRRKPKKRNASQGLFGRFLN